jgi:hypothetical protein
MSLAPDMEAAARMTRTAALLLGGAERKVALLESVAGSLDVLPSFLGASHGIPDQDDLAAQRINLPIGAFVGEQIFAGLFCLALQLPINVVRGLEREVEVVDGIVEGTEPWVEQVDFFINFADADRYFDGYS